MRINPPSKDKVLKKDDPRYIEAITRKVALAVVLVGVYIWFFKLLFL